MHHAALHSAQTRVLRRSTWLNVDIQLRRAWGYSVSLYGNGGRRKGAGVLRRLEPLNECRSEAKASWKLHTATLLHGISGPSFEARPHFEIPFSYRTGQDEL